MSPQLVIADQAVRAYPGGVIAIRCEDWLGAARGTLSTDTDTLSCTGTRVEDTQTVATSIFDDPEAAHDSASDTLVIPMSSIPVESPDDGIFYNMYISYRLIGDWDVTNDKTTRASTQWTFHSVGAVGWHGADGYTEDAANVTNSNLLARVSHYHVIRIGTNMEIFTTDTLRVRAFAQSGTTASWYLDQIILLPHGDFFSKQFRTIPGNWNSFSGADLSVIDGADGGDDNGKFTWGFNFYDSVENDASFDFQRKSDAGDAEYDIRVTENDPEWSLYRPGPTESKAHAYSLHCVRYREPGEIVHDDFSRVVSVASPQTGGWGLTPEGYEWDTSVANTGGEQTEVNGSVGILRIGVELAAAFATLVDTTSTAGPLHNRGGKLEISEYWNFSGTFSVNGNATWLADTTQGLDVRVMTLPTDLFYNIIFSAGSFAPFQNQAKGVWEFGYVGGDGTGPVTSLTGPVDETSWYTDGALVGWRIEKDRYIVRVRIWDASGAEPSTWEYEGFTRIASGGGTNYPYGDNSRLAGNTPYNSGGLVVPGPFTVRMDVLEADFPAQVETWWDDIIIEYDSFGDPADMTVCMEHPEGTQVGEQVVPFGAAYFVYWGNRDWTTIDGSEPRLDFSSKMWNDPAAAEMQRAEATLFYFRTGGVPLVPMNWRSSERKGAAWRWLIGSR